MKSEQFTQGCTQPDLEHHQGWNLHNLLVPWAGVLTRKFTLVSLNFSGFNLCLLSQVGEQPGSIWGFPTATGRLP